MRPVFACALGLSALLMFVVQPMIGRALLPLLGGAPAVWTTTMLFFQAALLVGYGWAMVKIEDPAVVATSGKTHHPIVAYTGADADRVAGTVFEITDAELAAADAYEVDAYKRVLAPLASGRSAWVYVDARHAPDADNP